MAERRLRRQIAALVATLAAVRMVRAGTVQVQASCGEQFGWMDNALEQSVCAIAAYLLSACTDDNWTLPALPNVTEQYTAPNASTQNSCQCSWAVYNAMQGCADCQGEDWEAAIMDWASWSQECAPNSLTNSSYFPENVNIPNTTAIPFWATTNPISWSNEKFDPTVAQQLANEDKPDITQSNRSGSPSSSSSPSSGSKGSNTGAVAGGVIGGVVALALLALLAFFFKRRRRRGIRVRRYKGTGILLPAHRRSDSDPLYTTRKVNIYDPFAAINPDPTSSPPLSGDNFGAGYGYGVGPGTSVGRRPPFQQSPSFATLPVTPPLNADPTRPFAAAAGMGSMSAMNGSNPTIGTTRPSGVPVPSGSPPVVSGHGHSHGHAHTMSSQSAYSQSSGGAHVDTREGAISPYVLPPVTAEPTSYEGDNIAHGRERASPGHHVKGSSGSSGSGGGVDYFSAIPASGANAPFRLERTRRNPPAYSPELEELGMWTEEAGGDDDNGARRDSLEVQPADTETQALSGTTLAQGSTAPSDRGARSEMARDRHRHPIDQKQP